ncbi:hypothetical protein ACNVD4_18785, partial [Rhizobium sp. BR5]
VCNCSAETTDIASMAALKTLDDPAVIYLCPLRSGDSLAPQNKLERDFVETMFRQARAKACG